MPGIGAGAGRGSGPGRPAPLPLRIFPSCGPAFMGAAVSSREIGDILGMFPGAMCAALTRPLQSNSLLIDAHLEHGFWLQPLSGMEQDACAAYVDGFAFVPGGGAGFAVTHRGVNGKSRRPGL